MVIKTNAERQAAFRAARKDRPEVRGIFAHPDDHNAIKFHAENLAILRRREEKHVLVMGQSCKPTT